MDLTQLLSHGVPGLMSFSLIFVVVFLTRSYRAEMLAERTGHRGEVKDSSEIAATATKDSADRIVDAIKEGAQTTSTDLREVQRALMQRTGESGGTPAV